MVGNIPYIAQVMTKSPRTIGKEELLDAASALMRELGVRHLPVVDKEGRVVGVISERELEFCGMLEGFRSVRVEAVMAKSPYLVNAEVQLDTVVKEMAKHKYGSAIIQDAKGQPIGIFTSIDALRVLDELLANVAQRHPHQTTGSR